MFININFDCKQSDPDNPEVLQLKNVSYDDEGWYTCIAANSLGQTAVKAYLRVTDSKLLKSDIDI